MLKQRYNISKIVNQYPWNLSKLKSSLYKRKWFRIKFNSQLLKSRKFYRKKFLKTYENKTKSLFKKFFSPGVTKKQFKKLFKFKNRFRSTFRQILKLEHRLDTILMRIYFLPNIEIARHAIKNNFFLVNNYKVVSPKYIVNVGDVVEIHNKAIWTFFYAHYLKVVSSLKKYYNRIFFKISYSFLPKRKKKLFKEDRWPKKRAVFFITKRIGKRFLLVRRKKNKKYVQLVFRASTGFVHDVFFKKIKKGIIQKRKPSYYIKKKLNNFNIIFNKKKVYFKKHRFLKKKLNFNFLNKKTKKITLILSQNFLIKKNNNIQAVTFKVKKISNKKKKIKKKNRYRFFKKSKKSYAYRVKAYKKKLILKKKIDWIKKKIRNPVMLKKNNVFDLFFNLPKIKTSNNLKLFLSLKNDLNLTTNKFKNLTFFNKTNLVSKRIFKSKLTILKKAKKYKLRIKKKKNNYFFKFFKKKKSIKNKLKIKFFLKKKLKKKKVFFRKKRKWRKPFWFKRKWVRFYWQKKRITKKLFMFVEFRKKFNNFFPTFKQIKNKKLVQFQMLDSKFFGKDSKLFLKNKIKILNSKNKNLEFKKKGDFNLFIKIIKAAKLFFGINHLKQNFSILSYILKVNFNDVKTVIKNSNKSFNTFKTFYVYLISNINFFKVSRVLKILKQNNNVLHLKKFSSSLLSNVKKLKKAEKPYIQAKQKLILKFKKIEKIVKKLKKSKKKPTKKQKSLNIIYQKLKKKSLLFQVPKKGFYFKPFVVKKIKELYLNTKIKKSREVSLKSINITNLMRFLLIYKKGKPLLKLMKFYKKQNLINFSIILKNIALELQNSTSLHFKNLETVCKIKRKYLKIKGFFRRFLNFKIENLLHTSKSSKIQIEYKKINLILKYRPNPIYYIEVNYNTLSFTMVNDFDFLNYPYKTLFDFNTISHFYSR